MTQEEQNYSPDEMRKVMRLMQMRLLNTALHHFNRIDVRTLRMLEALELFKGKAASIGDNVDIAVLKDPENPRRAKLPAGPLILYNTEGEKPTRNIVELPVLLFSEKASVRKTAMECLGQMIQNSFLIITPKTRSSYEKLSTNVISDKPSEWKSAAVTIADAFYDDLLVAIQGTHQSLQGGSLLGESLNFYAHKVLYPTISSLDSISLDVNNPENEHEQMAKMIGKIIANAQTLIEVCAGYYEKLGYIPLAPKYGIAEAVRGWLDAHPDTDAWKEVWDWANAAAGPIPRYHACCVFALHPELVPQGKLPDLWHNILTVVKEPAGKESEEPGSDALALRHDLTRHYTYHLEARLPESDGANIACLAWWLSAQVAALFSDRPEDSRFYRENWVKPALELSSHIWHSANPPIKRSVLRSVTLLMSSPWAVGLLSIMGDKLRQLAPGEQSEKVRAQFHDALVFHSISSLPFPLHSPNDPTFGLECSLAETVLRWGEYEPEGQRKALEQLVATSQELGNAEELCTALRKLGESTLIDQVAVSLALKAKAHTDPAIAEGVWKILSDADWRLKVLGNAETRILDLIIQAVSILQVDNRDKWFWLLPHYIAELCEKTHDEERRGLLFFYVLHTSLTSDTVSAVRRLLRGTHKAKLLELANDYRARVEAMRSKYPPWVTGKMRGLIANLRVV